MSDKPGVSTEKKHPHILQDEINALFKSEWQPWVGGILIGIISVLMYAYSRPWGVALGVRNWGEWMLYPLGVVKSAPPSPLSFTTSVTNLSLIYGSFVASLLAGQFALRMPNLRDSLRGVFGGVLMGIGAALGMGCTIGGFYTSFISLSLAGPLMMAGLLMGAYLGLKLLIWDISR
ncbi:MAG: YeeE/YedE family protein, partial [Deltaproteobacteria bacterium]|nr:YeeE/YedE family protein [Deltaproteobacteria bacterium]